MWLIVLILIGLCIYWAKIGADARKDAEHAEKIAWEHSKKWHPEYRFANYRGKENRVVCIDNETGEHYIEKRIGDHMCRFTPNGKLLHDVTQEQLDRDLGGERERAIREGRRLYMVDNRKRGCLYQDIKTGKKYAVGLCFGIITVERKDNKCTSDSIQIEYPFLYDPKTLIVYDVIDQPREYLKDGVGISFHVKETLAASNWFAINDKEKLFSRQLKSYTLGHFINGQLEMIWSDYLSYDIRPEFKELDEFPIIFSETEPIDYWDGTYNCEHKHHFSNEEWEAEKNSIVGATGRLINEKISNRYVFG